MYLYITTVFVICFVHMITHISYDNIIHLLLRKPLHRKLGEGGGEHTLNFFFFSFFPNSRIDKKREVGGGFLETLFFYSPVQSEK